MLHQYIDSEGNKLDLPEEANNAFDQLLKLMCNVKIDNLDQIRNLIKSYPILVNAFYHNSELNTLHFAADIPTTKGLFLFKLLLENGAELNSRIINQMKHSSSNPFKKDFLKLAYKYAKTAELKIEIDHDKFIGEQQTYSAHGSTLTVENSYDFNKPVVTTESSSEYNKPVVVKTSGCSFCVISMVHQGSYDNNLLNHPKIQKMLEVAKQKSMLNELINLGQDKFIAEAITTAIAETKHKIYIELFPNGVDEEQTAREIDSALEDLSIEQVLNTLLTQPAEPKQEIIPFSASSLTEAPEALEIGDLMNISKIPGQAASQLARDDELSVYLVIRNTITQTLASFINAAKLLEILSFMARSSGNPHFIGGFHGGNPDDGFGGADSIAFNYYKKDNANAEEFYGLPGNYSSLNAM